MKATRLQSAVRVGLALIIAAMVALSWLAPLDSVAHRYVDAGLKRALVSFATARALNAAISVAQGTEVAVQPAGIGVILSPGQALDPINDLVEQFSNLMLTASVAFGVEKVLISIGAHWVVSLMLTIAAAAWFAFISRKDTAPHWLSRLLILLLMIRFAIPVVTIGSDLLFRQFMETDYQSSQRGIESVSGHLEKIDTQDVAKADDRGVLDRFKGWAAQQTDFKSLYANLKASAEQATERIITLMVIFLLQTLVFPVALLWIMWSIARRIFEAPPDLAGGPTGTSAESRFP